MENKMNFKLAGFILTGTLALILTGFGLYKDEPKVKVPARIMGADISFLPQLEAEGRKFYINGMPKDAIKILKETGFNYIRLRLFNNPRADSGYSKKGYCDIAQTKEMALRIKAAKMGFLLDFHYSDTWADPAKQFKPAAWKTLSFLQMQDSIRVFTRNSLLALKKQGTLPQMVQVGNEINHGMLWPDGNIKNLDTLAAFLKAGIKGVKDVDQSIRVMLHIACGGQTKESEFFVDNMLKRGVTFDILGQSYYPEWHGTPDSLRNNLTLLTKKYKQDVIVVEYSQHKQQVNDVAFNLPGNKLKGTFIWEPLSWGETIFDKAGKANTYLDTFKVVSKKYQIKQQ
jgi:arabinogalactan endo-1,4-beta-galactosidase